MNKFVLQVPRWQGELLFSRELLTFLGVILLMIVGTLFCFWGYKYFQTVLFLGIGTVVCYIAYLLVEPMTKSLVIRLFLTVSLTFLGVCFVYFLDIIFGYILDRLRIRGALGKRAYLLTAPMGAAILGLTIYIGIWRDAVVATVISVVCLACGLPFQHARRKKQVRFCCYNDLLRLKYPNVEDDGLEYITPETAAVPAETVVKAEAEPEVSAEAVMKAEMEPEVPVEAVVRAEAEPETPAVIAVEAEVEKVDDTMRKTEVEVEKAVDTAVEVKVEEAVDAVAEVEVVNSAAEMEVEKVVDTMAEAEAEPEKPAAAVAKDNPEPETDGLVPVAEMHIKPLAMTEGKERENDGAKYLLFRKPEQESDILEDAVFMRQIKSAVETERSRRKQIDTNMAALAAARYAETAIKNETPVSADRVPASAAGGTKTGAQEMQTAKKRDMQKSAGQKMRRKQDKKIAQVVAITATGVSLFLAGRASKGRD